MKRILIILISLILFLLTIIYFNDRTAQDNDLIIKYGETEQKIEDLSDFGSTVISTKRGDNYLAISILEMAITLEINTDNFDKVVFHSSDGGSLVVNIFELSDLYLVENKNDEKEFLRLVIPTDDFPQRWLKYINRIEFTNA